jgi:hypothetical protein
MARLAQTAAVGALSGASFEFAITVKADWVGRQ